jgi:hypothetical protein
MHNIKKISLQIGFLTILLLPFVLIFSSCTVLGALDLGEVVSEQRQISGIKGISIGSSMNLIIEQTGSESVRIEAAKDLMPSISTEVVEGKLMVELNRTGFTGIKPINCYVSVKDLEALNVSSSASVRCDSLQVEDLSVNMASSSKGNINVNATNLNLTIASSANLTISGKTDSQITKVNSSGNLNAFNLISKNCKIEVNSSGNANINVIDNLDVKVNSSAKVNYKGNPKVNSDVASAGSLNNVGE